MLEFDQNKLKRQAKEAEKKKFKHPHKVVYIKPNYMSKIILS